MSVHIWRVNTNNSPVAGAVSRWRLVNQSVTGPAGADGAGVSVATKEAGTEKVAVTTVLDFLAGFDVAGAAGVASVSLDLTEYAGGALPLANGGTGATTAADARTALGLGTSATTAATSYDPAGSAAAAQAAAIAASQPVDADLTTIAAANNGTVLAATTASFLIADESKLDGIEAGATADQSAAEILAALLTVDGAGSGLDADLLDGNSSAAFATAAQGTLADNAVPKSLYDANTILAATADNTPAALTVGASTFVGRKATGDIAAMSAAEAAALLTTLVPKATFPETIAIACSDMTTAITTGTTKAYWVAPWACTLTAVKATLATAGTGTGTTIDINEGAGAGTSVLSTKLTIDVSETDSADATTAAVISDSAIAANGRITIDFDAVGTGAAGVIVYLTVTRAL